MLKSKIVATLCAVAFTALSCLNRAEGSPLSIIGSGPDSSFLVIEGFIDGPLCFELRYTYDMATPLDGYDLFTAAIASNLDLSSVPSNFGTDSEPSYFVDSITYKGETFTNTPFPMFGPFWAQWISGGEGYDFLNGVPEPAASGSWSFGAGMSAPYRALAPGSWDGYVFNEGDAAPSVAPVPEPGSVLLLLGAGFVLAAKRRRS